MPQEKRDELVGLWSHHCPPREVQALGKVLEALYPFDSSMVVQALSGVPQEAWVHHEHFVDFLGRFAYWEGDWDMVLAMKPIVESALTDLRMRDGFLSLTPSSLGPLPDSGCRSF